MLPCSCTGCILGRAPRTDESFLDFHEILGLGKRGLNVVVSSYSKSTNLPRVDRLSTDSWDLGRHSSEDRSSIVQELKLVHTTRATRGY